VAGATGRHTKPVQGVIQQYTITKYKVQTQHLQKKNDIDFFFNHLPQYLTVAGHTAYATTRDSSLRCAFWVSDNLVPVSFLYLHAY